MIETKRYCYCDILSEHNNNKVAGATTYKDIIIMKTDDDGNVFLSKGSIDMCANCYAKYHSNLFLNVDNRGRISYTFDTAQDSSDD